MFYSHLHLKKDLSFLSHSRHRVFDEEGFFEGYASLFNILDQGHDVIVPGAFKEGLQAKGIRNIKLLWQHESSDPIGCWVEIQEDIRGLFVRGYLNPKIARSRDVLTLLKDGAIDGLSIGFELKQFFIDPTTNIRYVQKVNLWEISIVTFPMLPQARIHFVKDENPEESPSYVAKNMRSIPEAISFSNFKEVEYDQYRE